MVPLGPQPVVILLLTFLCAAPAVNAYPRLLFQLPTLTVNESTANATAADNATTAQATNATNTTAAAMPVMTSSVNTTYPANCTPPRTKEDAAKPFCFVPDTASQDAKGFLTTMASSATGLGGDLYRNRTALQEVREFYKEFSINGSNAAVDTFLQDVRNDTIGNVSVVSGVPKGSNATMSPNDTKLLIYLHGGGYIIGSCQYQLSTAVPTAARAGLTTLCIEYRLAPEHPFPAGLNDILTVYKELLKQGYQAKNMVLLGDSAGGGLVAATAIQLQREGLPLPAALGMFSPWVELETKLDSEVTMIAVDPLLSGPDPSMSLAYVDGNTALASDPLVSPLRANYSEIFAGGKLPPTLIQVGLRETVLSHAVLLYHKMKAAGPNPTRVLISPYDAMWHVFQSYFTMPEAVAAHEEMADFFARSLNGTLCST